LADTAEEDKLTGVPTSRGYFTGPTRVVHGLEDFKKVQPGDVLIIPFSDVSWSVLFTRAKAIIAESGGMLSHSSILAREYQIPAVVSVPGAMLLQDDMLVTVDGYRGEVILHTKAGIQQNEESN
jgi:phosphoenolpyruvate synthase/pyruvate phosphate dikinase